MAHNYFTLFRKKTVLFCLAGIALVAGSKNASAGQPEFVKLNENKPFVLSAGAGYGVSNNPCMNCGDHLTIGGATFSISLGYKINDQFKIEFGPSFWIEGSDLLNKNVADSERPNNKRTIVTFTATFTVSQKLPLSVKLGGGAGVLNYTPDKSTVKLTESEFAETEIFKGFSGTFGLAYEIRLSTNLKLYPSMNLWYIRLEQPAFEHRSYIDYNKASITTDFRINLNYNF